MKHEDFQMKEVQINSGEFAFFYQEPVTIKTLVGVCIALCIWDTHTKSGGMCHYRLPIAPDSMGSNDNPNDFGSKAILNLLKKFKHNGSRIENLQAWIIGGGKMHEGIYIQSQKIGERNISQAFKHMAQFGIPVIGVSTGGFVGRQIRFNPFIGHLDFRFVINGFYRSTSLKNNPADLLSRLNISEISKEKPKIIYIVPASNNEVKQVHRALLSLNKTGHIQTFENINEALKIAQHSQPDVIVFESHHLHSNWMQICNINKLQTPCIVLCDAQPDLSSDLYAHLSQACGDNIFVSSGAVLEQVMKAALQIKDPRLLEFADNFDNNDDKDITFLKSTHNATSLIVLGSSTGGIEALEVVLKELPASIPPVCIVQHIPKGYTRTLVSRLNQHCAVEVCEAVDGMVLEPSTIYISPGDVHMKLSQIDANKLVIRLTKDKHVNGFRPSVDLLFNSAQNISGRRIVGVLLTGMGRDGALGLFGLKQKGAFTLVQDEKSSVVFGMGRTAKEMGAACRTVPLVDICSSMLEALFHKNIIPETVINVPTEPAINASRELALKALCSPPEKVSK